MDIHALKTKCRWLFGPKFLLQPEDQWPVKEIGKIPDDNKEVEVEKRDVHHAWNSVRPPSKMLFIMALTADVRGMVNAFRGLHRQQEWSS